MNNTRSFDDIVAEIIALRPPKRRNKNDPRIQAEDGIKALAEGKPVCFSQAANYYLPGELKQLALRRVYRQKNTFGYVLLRHRSAAVMLLRFLLNRKWQTPRNLQACQPGAGKTAKGEGVSPWLNTTSN